MAEAIRFTDLREMMAKLDALAKRVDAAPVDPAPMVGQFVSGAMLKIDERLTEFAQKIAEHEQRMANLALEVRSAIPLMPDLGPFVAALEAVTQRLDTNAGQAPADPSGLAAVMQGMNDTLKAVREMCARMDKPVVREGVADLPSGTVKLRITETRTR